MTETLFVAVGESCPVRWLVLDEGTGVITARDEGDFATLAALGNEVRWSGRTRILVHGEHTLLTKAAIPSRQQRQILQALPFMVEEQLAAEIEDCHFAAGDRDSDGSVSVAVTEKALLKGWLDALLEAGIKPGMVTPDVLQVPWDGGISILVDGNRALVRTGRFEGFGIDITLLPAAMELVESDPAGGLQIFVHPAEQAGVQLYLSQLEAGFAGVTSTIALEYSAFEFLCRHFDASAINMLQGPLAVGDPERARRGGWRTVAVVAACVFGLHVMTLVGQGIYLDVQADQLEREALALYREVFPNDGNVRDIRRRWQAHLGRNSSQPGGEFFDVFRQAVGHLPGSDLTVQNVNFNEGRGDLVLQLSAAGSEQFVAFAQQLSNAGISAELGAISQDATSARGTIKVTAAGRGR